LYSTFYSSTRSAYGGCCIPNFPGESRISPSQTYGKLIAVPSKLLTS
jgi:hypothetical protein